MTGLSGGGVRRLWRRLEGRREQARWRRSMRDLERRTGWVALVRDTPTVRQAVEGRGARR